MKGYFSHGSLPDAMISQCLKGQLARDSSDYDAERTGFKWIYQLAQQ
jgi:hypothetical protein